MHDNQEHTNQNKQNDKQTMNSTQNSTRPSPIPTKTTFNLHDKEDSDTNSGDGK